jgi:hypothetical protein
VRPPHAGAREGVGRIGEVVIGLATDDAEQGHTLARPGQGLPDGPGVDERAEGLEASPSLD